MTPLAALPGIPLIFPPGEMCGVEVSFRPGVSLGSQGERYARRLTVTSPRDAAWIKKSLNLAELPAGLVVAAGTVPEECPYPLCFVRCPQGGVTPRERKIFMAYLENGLCFVGLRPGAPDSWPEEIAAVLQRGSLFGYRDVAREGFKSPLLVTADPSVLAPATAWEAKGVCAPRLFPGYDLLRNAVIGERMWLAAQAP